MIAVSRARLLASVLATVSPAALAQDKPTSPQAAASSPSPEAPPSSAPPETIYTYFGLRNLERREDVTDEEKLKEWEAFIHRTEEQIGYAKKQVVFWRNAARLRLVESVQADDKDPAIEPRLKIDAWKRIAAMFPKTEEARVAEKRVAFWKASETKRLVDAAEIVEQSKTTKVERIRAWRLVIDWDPKGEAAKGATKRIAALQKQIHAEATSLDKIGRVDAATKLAVWKDVLAGEPTPAQKKEAEARIRALESQP
ncbi:MAG: hypothetical protein HYV07_25235 [Deltaproteobacteria bacterium]|nr:hypothetical protein [Deltaproteobacteria bacterium]